MDNKARAPGSDSEAILIATYTDLLVEGSPQAEELRQSYAGNASID